MKQTATVTDKRVHENRSSRRARLRHNSHEADAGRERWLISYSDLLTLLFALFVVLYASADHERARAIADAITRQMDGLPAASKSGINTGGSGVLPGADSYAQARGKIEQAFASSERLRQRAVYKETERGIVVSLAEAGFFAPGDATVRDDALPIVDELANALHDANASVRIEGHTDATPIATPRFPSNWELSAARAASVLARLARNGVASSRLSVAGYADEQPIADNATPQGRALNRRVDLVVLRN
jgi:chemotaxis protein MotB